MMAASVKKLILSCGAITLITSSQIDAQQMHKCGDLPTAPEIINGKDTALEKLIANSKDVNKFIEEADKYLDCQAGFKKKAKKLPKDIQEQLKTENSSLLDQRNEIGDTFNEQVAAYREANP